MGAEKIQGKYTDSHDCTMTVDYEPKSETFDIKVHDANDELIYQGDNFDEAGAKDLLDTFKANKFGKGGEVGVLVTSYKNPLEYLKAMGAQPFTDLNYSTKKNGIDFYIGQKGNKAIVVAFIENEDKYMISKEDAREMALSAKTKGIESVELYTNYGIELHSRHEKPKDIGFDKIYKVQVGSMAKGGEVSTNKTWIVNINMPSEKGFRLRKEEIILGRMSDEFDVQQAIKRKGEDWLGNGKVLSIVQKDAKGGEIKIFNIGQEIEIYPHSQSKGAFTIMGYDDLGGGSFQYVGKFKNDKTTYRFLPNPKDRKFEKSFGGSMAKGGEVSESPKTYFSSLKLSELSEQAQNYIKSEILSDPDIEILGVTDEDFVEVKGIIEKNFPKALPTTEAPKPTASILESRLKILNKMLAKKATPTLKTRIKIVEKMLGKFNQGGEIPNNYQGKTAEQVWDEWTKKQREHFIEDHYLCEKNLKQRRTADLQKISYGNSLIKYIEFEWKKIPDVPVKWSLERELFNHISNGQYAGGGEIKKLCPVGTEIQSLLFDKKDFDRKAAIDWAKEHDFHSKIVTTEGDYIHIRQQHPNLFKKDSIRTIDIAEFIKARIGCPKHKSKK